MTLQRYRAKYWFPSGALAVNVPARIFLYDNNVFATIYTDATGVTQLPNPVNTDGAGFLEFWAEEGQYWVHIDEETFLVDVGMSEEESDLSSGTASGGELNIATPTSVEIRAVVGYVVDNTSLDQVAPTKIKVDEPTQVVALDAGALARSITFWLMDSTGAVIQQATPPTPEQRRTHLELGVSFFDTGLVSLVEVQTLPVILPQAANQFVDLLDTLGPFSVSGNLLTPNGVNLSFNKASGVLFSRASNHFVSGVLTDNPHISPSPAQTPATFRRILRTASTPTPPPVTTVDPTMFDNAGVLTPVGGGTNTSTIQRVWAFATNVTSAQLAVQYGQQTFASLSAAVAAIDTAVYVPAPIASSGSLIGYICMTRVATNLSDPTQAVFVQPNTLLTRR